MTKRRSKSTRIWKVGNRSSLQGVGAKEENEEDGEMEEEEEEEEDISVGKLDGAGDSLVWTSDEKEDCRRGVCRTLDWATSAEKHGFGRQVVGFVELLLGFECILVNVGCTQSGWREGAMQCNKGRGNDTVGAGATSELWAEGKSVAMVLIWVGERSWGTRGLQGVISHLCQKGSFSSLSLSAGLGEYKRSSRSLK